MATAKCFPSPIGDEELAEFDCLIEFQFKIPNFMPHKMNAFQCYIISCIISNDRPSYGLHDQKVAASNSHELTN